MAQSTAENQPERTWKDHLKNFSAALFMVFTPLLVIEIALQLTDPWGIVYFDDIVTMSEHFIADEDRGYILPDGYFEYSHWSATIVDGVRQTTVDSSETVCDVVLIGDSVTFGYGVDDEAAWGNVLANQFPEIYIRNAGVTQYASDNVLRTYQAFDADVYIYLIINNDWQESPAFGQGVLTNPANQMPRLVNYLQFLFLRKPEEEAGAFGDANSSQPYERFLSDIDVMSQDEGMVFLAFEDDAIGDIVSDAGYDIERIAPYPIEHRISFVDVHLNDTGNEILAGMIAPIMEQAVAEQCE